MDLEKTEAKNDCAGECQQQFNQPTELVSGEYTNGEVRGSQSLQRIKLGHGPLGLGTKNHCAGEDQ
jgi:hypothetical protein